MPNQHAEGVSLVTLDLGRNLSHATDSDDEHRSGRGAEGAAVLTHSAARSDALALRDRGVVVTGEVVAVHGGTRYSDASVEVRFEDQDGDVVVSEVFDHVWDPRPRVGDPTTVLYDPEAPDVIRDVRAQPSSLAVWALGAGALVASALVLPTWTGRISWAGRR